MADLHKELGIAAWVADAMLGEERSRPVNVQRVVHVSRAERFLKESAA